MLSERRPDPAGIRSYRVLRLEAQLVARDLAGAIARIRSALLESGSK